MPLKGYKTFSTGIAIMLLAVFSNADMQAFFAQHLPAVGASVGTIMIVLRAITSTALFSKE